MVWWWEEGGRRAQARHVGQVGSKQTNPNKMCAGGGRWWWHVWQAGSVVAGQAGKGQKVARAGDKLYAGREVVVGTQYRKGRQAEVRRLAGMAGGCKGMGQGRKVGQGSEEKVG